MATKNSTLKINILSDASGAGKGFDEADDKASRLGSTLGKVGLAVGVAGAAAVVLGKECFDAASNLQQQAGAVDAVFGAYAERMNAFAADAATNVGLSTAAYSELAAVLGSQLGNAGFAGDELTGKVDTLITKGADLAAQFGGSSADAVAALSSALKGETDPIEKYGVSLKQVDINAQLASRGQDNLTGAALKQATAQAVLDLVTQQTTTSQGAFARESDTAAGVGQTLTAKLDNLKAALGERLLPIFVDVASFVSDKVIPAIEDLTDKNGPAREAFDKVGKIIKENVVPVVRDFVDFARDKLVPILKDVGKFITDTVVPAFKKVWEFVQDYVIPIFKSTLGPALDGVRDAFKKVSEKINENKDKFQEAYDKAKPFFEFLRDKLAPFLGGALKLAFETIGTVIGKVVDAIAFVLDKAGSVVGFVGDLFGAGGGGQVSAPAAARTAGTQAPLRFGAGTGGGLFTSSGSSGLAAVQSAPANVTVTINGVLDADDAARQVRRLLENFDAFTGQTAAVVM